MSEIRRFDPLANTGFDECWASMDEWENGDYVLYADHAKIVAELKAEIEQAYNKGHDDGRWAGYHELNKEFYVGDLQDE